MAIIGIDMDDTLFEFNRVLLAFYNATYHDNLKYEDITDYDIRNFIKKECEDYWREFTTDEVMLGLEPMPNSINVTQKLSVKNDNKIVTAGHPFTSPARHTLLQEHYPWYNQSKFYRVPHKQLLKMDILIDDAYMNFVDFDGVKIIINRPWNLKYDDPTLIRVNDWFEIESLLDIYF